MLGRAWRALEARVPYRLAVEMRFLRVHRRRARLRKPRSFPDYIVRRGLYDSDPRLARLADKIEVKRHVEEVLGSNWTIPSLYEGEALPPRHERRWQIPFVVKASHGCGWNVFIRDPNELNWSAIEKRVDVWLQSSYGSRYQERFYDRIKPRLLVEPLLGASGALLDDYKFLCFGGRCEYIVAQSERHLGLKAAVMDRNWVLQPVLYAYDPPKSTPPPPTSLGAMLEAAECLAMGFDFVRVDFYEVKQQPLLGELTFTPGAGMHAFKPHEFNLRLGALWRAAEAARS